MKSLFYVTDDLKKYGLIMLIGYKRAQPILRLKDLLFKESDFKILFDKKDWTSPEKKLVIGDVCRFNENFYESLYDSAAMQSSVAKSIMSHYFSEYYVIIAFVELNSKNHRDTFCVLGRANNPRASMLNIQKNEDTLLLFWPEGLEKVEDK
jgi:hypothetical protein